MLSIGLTGGIAAGKSLLSARFRELGAVLIDADQLARDVVAPGTGGLAAVVQQFGDGVLLHDGSLDRPKLGSIVFGDAAARQSLNGIIHPLVRAAANALKADAGPGTIVVQDIPLLVESGQAASFHLVVVVEAPEETRLARMVQNRGMSEADARARLAAQAGDAERAAAADVIIVNDGSPGSAVAQLDALWHTRLVPFAANLAAGVAARAVAGTGHPAQAAGSLAARNLTAGAAAARTKARLALALGEAANGIGGADAVELPGEQSGTGLHLGIRLKDPAGQAEALEALAAAGYFPVAGSSPMVLQSSDPGLDVTVTLH